MVWCKEDVTPVRSQWSYVFLALTHRFDVIRDDVMEWKRFSHYYWPFGRGIRRHPWIPFTKGQ